MRWGRFDWLAWFAVQGTKKAAGTMIELANQCQAGSSLLRVVTVTAALRALTFRMRDGMGAIAG
jgi:hypothetical protein